VTFLELLVGQNDMVYTKISSCCCFSCPKTWLFQNYGSHRPRKRFDKQGLSNTDLQTATPAKHFWEQSRTKETWKCKPNRKENRVKKLKEGPGAHQKCINQLQRWCNPLNEPIWQKGQLWRPPKRGHVSCRKSVSHERTSTVSDSEALIHLAYVQHLWQSKLVVILEDLTR